MRTVKSSLAVLLSVASLTASPQSAGQPSDSSLGSRLPANVRALLIEEMNAILRSTHTILDAIVRGQHPIVEEQARAIHDSFILEQQMTPEERTALLEAATPSFIEMDEAFHALAERLAEAGRRGDHAAQRAAFADMLDACAACHAEHARDRFPGLQPGPAEAR